MVYNLYKSDEERAEAAIRERWPDLGEEEPCEDFDLRGFHDGQRAGRSAAFNRSVEDGPGARDCA